jgi:hypothetical protein
VKWSNLKPLYLPVTGNIFTGNGKEKNRKFTGLPVNDLPVITSK